MEEKKGQALVSTNEDSIQQIKYFNYCNLCDMNIKPNTYYTIHRKTMSHRDKTTGYCADVCKLFFRESLESHEKDIYHKHFLKVIIETMGTNKKCKCEVCKENRERLEYIDKKERGLIEEVETENEGELEDEIETEDEMKSLIQIEYECKLCNTKFTDKDKHLHTKQHLKNEKKEKENNEEYCGCDDCLENIIIEVEVKNIEQSPKFTCLICRPDKPFKDNWHLNRHLNSNEHKKKGESNNSSSSNNNNNNTVINNYNIQINNPTIINKTLNINTIVNNMVVTDQSNIGQYIDNDRLICFLCRPNNPYSNRSNFRQHLNNTEHKRKLLSIEGSNSNQIVPSIQTSNNQLEYNNNNNNTPYIDDDRLLCLVCRPNNPYSNRSNFKQHLNNIEHKRKMELAIERDRN
jgi:hypothetical protein